MKNKIFSIEEPNKLNIDQVRALYAEFINPNQTKIFSSLPYGMDLFKSAEGVIMTTEKNKEILDFTGGLGVLGLGHNHPRILKARIKFQNEKKVEVHKIIFSSYMATLAASLAHILNCNLKKSFFLNSGAEAVEAAMKITFKSFKGVKKNILFSNKSYHGKLIGSGSISGSYKKENQFPFLNNCFDFKCNDPQDLEKQVINYHQKGGIYAVIIEPFSASLLEPCSKEFIKKVFDLKKKYNFRVIFDEVFTGFYKSEKMFYFQNFDFEPDAICLSKALGGGKSSISSIVVSDEVYNKAYNELNDTFLHTTTYNGFGEESVTALEAINVFAEKSFEDKVIKLSKTLKEKLYVLQKKYPDKIESVKGTGILNGIIFKSFSSSISNIVEKIPIKIIKNKSFFLKKLTAQAISCELYEKYNILTSISESSNSNHLNISPSLIIDEKNINYFFESLDRVLGDGVNSQYIKIVMNFLKQ